MKRMKKKSLFKYDIKKKHNKSPLKCKGNIGRAGTE